MSKFINYLDLKLFVEKLVKKLDRPVTLAEIREEYSEEVGEDLDRSRMSAAMKKLACSSINLFEETENGKLLYDTWDRKNGPRMSSKSSVFWPARSENNL